MALTSELLQRTLLIAIIYMLSIEVGANAKELNDPVSLENDENLIVHLPNGKLRGRDNGYFYSYESIPYAEAPIGELRFEAPKLYEQKWADIFDATKEPVACMQWDQYYEAKGTNLLHGEEDCLTINIYKPKSNESAEDNESTRSGEKLPVLVFIHGGAFMFGSVMGNNHELFMRSGRLIVAKMTYRLGPLGFLSTEDAELPGNYGLKDQRLALQWLKQHIKQFGGDPDKMLVMGFSSGAAAVHLQMLQPEFAQYAKAAVSISGTAFNPWVIMRNSRARAFEMARNLNCPNLDNTTMIKACLKSLSAQTIVSDVRSFLVFGYNPFTTFGPVIETAETATAFLTQQPEQILAAGNFTQVPWLVSYALQDGGYNAAELLQKTPRHNEELIEVLNERWYDLAPYTLFFKDSVSSIEELDDYSMALKRRYMDEKDFSLQNYEEFQRMYTDVLFKNGIEKTVRLHRNYSASPIYAYVYDNPAEEGIGTFLSKRKDVKLGTVHGDDFFLIFQNSRRGQSIRPDEQVISQKFIKMLEDFAQNSSKLSFGSCDFVNNVGKESLELMFITRDGCESKSVRDFPS